MRANQDIRAAMNESDVKFWECAERIGISAGTLTVWLRRELPEEKKAMVLTAIETIAAER